VDKGRTSRPVGKMSFDAEKLLENIKVLVSELLRVKPSSAKVGTSRA